MAFAGGLAMIRATLKHVAFLGLVSTLLLAAAVFGGGGWPPAEAAASALQQLHLNRVAPE